MIFSRNDAGTVTVALEQEAAKLLAVLAGQVAELIDDREEAEDDPALTRLLPTAYLDDDAAAAEFRRFTESELARLKLHNAGTVVESLDGWPEIELDPAGVRAWLRALTDIRMVLASRLGIETDDDEGDVSTEEGAMLRNIYDWLGMLQGSLVDAVDS
jgi:hypothetical protein